MKAEKNLTKMMPSSLLKGCFFITTMATCLFAGPSAPVHVYVWVYDANDGDPIAGIQARANGIGWDHIPYGPEDPLNWSASGTDTTGNDGYACIGLEDQSVDLADLAGVSGAITIPNNKIVEDVEVEVDPMDNYFVGLSSCDQNAHIDFPGTGEGMAQIYLYFYLREVAPDYSDLDNDCMSDELEDYLALKFLPTLWFGSAEHTPRPGKIIYRARPHPDDPQDVAITYVVLYYCDGGDDTWGGAHLGDNEAFSISLTPYPFAPDVTRDYALYSLRAFAHWGTIFQETTTEYPYRWDAGCEMHESNPSAAEDVWIAEDKHANYINDGECDDGGFWGSDNCECDLLMNDGDLVSPAYGQFWHLYNVGEEGAPLMDDLTSIGFYHEHAWQDQDFDGGDWALLDPDCDECTGAAGVIRDQLVDLLAPTTSAYVTDWLGKRDYFQANLNPPTSAPDSYIEDFEDGRADDWIAGPTSGHLYEGGSASGWQVANGQYYQSKTDWNYISCFAEYAYANMSYEADVWILSAGGNAGLDFCITNLDHGYGFHILEGENKARLALYKTSGDELIASVPYSIAPNTKYTLRVEISAGRIQCYVNDSPVIDVNNNTYFWGFVGLETQICQAKFDNVNITGSAPFTSITTTTDNFNDDDADSWIIGPHYGKNPIAPGNWAVESDEYSQSSTDWSYISVLPRIATNFTFEADVKIKSSGKNAGLDFRMQDFDNYYGFHLVDQNNTVRLAKYTSTGDEILGSVAYTVNPDVTYTLKVVAHGYNIRCYVNDVEKINVNDDSYNRGCVGLETQTGHVHFDNAYLRPSHIVVKPVPGVD